MWKCKKQESPNETGNPVTCFNLKFSVRTSRFYHPKTIAAENLPTLFGIVARPMSLDSRKSQVSA